MLDEVVQYWYSLLLLWKENFKFMKHKNDFVTVSLYFLLITTDKISRVFNTGVAYQGCSSVAVDTSKYQRLSAGFNKIVFLWTFFSNLKVFKTFALEICAEWCWRGGGKGLFFSYLIWNIFSLILCTNHGGTCRRIYIDSSAALNLAWSSIFGI